MANNKNNYTHYVVFSPAESIGIYTQWDIVEPLVIGVRNSAFMGLWSQKQAEIALARGYKEALVFKAGVIERGENKPTRTIDPKDYVMKW